MSDASKEKTSDAPERTEPAKPKKKKSSSSTSASSAPADGGAEGASASKGEKYKRKTEKSDIVVKVGMVGDSEVGKTSLMVRYVEGKFDEDYIVTLGVNFMEKKITIRNNDINFSIWDLGGQREFLSMLPLVCNDAVAILFLFDLSRKSTLVSIREWFRQARGFNKTAKPFLIGTKYDLFTKFPPEEQEDITKQARKFAKAMKAPLIFCSANASINVLKIFKVVLAKAFDLRCNIEEITKVGEPILEYS